jgi:MSHA biogenesis protein MshP
MRRAWMPGRQQGSLIIVAVFLLVVLAGLVAYLTSISTTTQAASAADASSARAYQAARAGIEWATYQVLRNSAGSFTTGCSTNPLVPTIVNTPALGGTLSGYVVTVKCTKTGPLTEGASPTLVVYKIVANACNIPDVSNCPNTSSVSATYVERELSVTLTN